VSGFAREHEILQAPKNAPIWLVPAGAAISFVGALCGIGGGLFVVPLLYYLRAFPMRSAVATSVVHVLATAGFATAAELFQRDHALHYGLLAALGAGALLGAELGYRISKRIDAFWLKSFFALVALAAGAKILYEVGAGRGVYGTVEFAASVSGWTLALAFAIGAAGAMLTPLLGLGGGLIFVPALHLSLPELDYNTIRACSLAVVTIGAARSTWLYASEGAIHGRSAWWLGVGGAVGAAFGVIAVHQPSGAWLRGGRIALALILVYVALRFALEARAARRARA
jgi:uncharacterized membrane protein YfcA